MSSVIFDSNIYYMGLKDKEGISSVLLEMGREGKLKVFASEALLQEASKNLKAISPEMLECFHQYLKETNINVIPSQGSTASKENHVEYISKSCSVDCLITLEPELYRKNTSLKVCSPSELFIQTK